MLHHRRVDRDFDALVVGGAAAGLSAALVLGRARVRTLVVDAGQPSNSPAHAIGGLLGQDGTSPAQLYAAGREQVAALPSVELRVGVVTGIEPAAGDGADPAFRATLGDGAAVAARRVLLAGGMRYAVPETPGLEALWGDTAFVCPYCHGWENRDRRIGILGAAGAAHRVALLRSWSEDLVVLADCAL
jgi:thioredoxin reductase